MKILNTNIRLDGNHLYKLELTVDELPTTDETVLLEDEEQKYVYGETPDGYVTYGCIAKNAHHGNEPGYRWSSRASVFNGMFGKRCMEVVFIEKYRYAGDMTIDAILPFLPDEFYIVEQVETDKHGNITEITYRISNYDHEKERQWYFKDITCSDGSRRYIRNRIFNNKPLNPDLYSFISAYRRNIMDNDMLERVCRDISESGKYSLCELNKFASYMEENFSTICSLKFFNNSNGGITFYLTVSTQNNNDNKYIKYNSEDNTSNQSPNYIPYPDQFPHLTRQSIVETILDMWLSSKDIEYIKEYWLGFWKDPLRYKDSAIANMIRQDVRERMI
jgi:hypothetical protein